jgi:hypothetical protein
MLQPTVDQNMAAASDIRSNNRLRLTRTRPGSCATASTESITPAIPFWIDTGTCPGALMVASSADPLASSFRSF